MHRIRDRAPRFFGPDRVLMPYSAVRSNGQELLRRVCQGRFKNDYYVTHYELADGELLLVSHRHLLYFEQRPQVELIWSEPLSLIAAIEGSEEGGVILRLRDTQTKRVIRTRKDQTMLVYDWLMEQIKQYVNELCCSDLEKITCSRRLKLLYTNALIDRNGKESK